MPFSLSEFFRQKKRGSMTDKQILKSIKALARGECANYAYGYCLLTDKGCPLVNPDDESVHEGIIDCNYFMECVLPADWNMKDLVSYALWYDEEKEEELPQGMKRCDICQKPFIPAHPKQKYCEGCSEKVNHKKDCLRHQSTVPDSFKA